MPDLNRPSVQNGFLKSAQHVIVTMGSAFVSANRMGEKKESASIWSCRFKKRTAHPSLPSAFMYSSKFWLSVSFQVAQKASTILALSPCASEADKSGGNGDLRIAGPLQFQRPLVPHRSSCLYFEKRLAESQGFELKHIPSGVSLSRRLLKGQGMGRERGGRLGRFQSSLWLARATASGVGRVPPVLAAQPFCLRNLCKGSMRLEAGSGKMREGLSDSAWNLAKAISGCEKRKKKSWADIQIDFRSWQSWLQMRTTSLQENHWNAKLFKQKEAE